MHRQGQQERQLGACAVGCTTQVNPIAGITTVALDKPMGAIHESSVTEKKGVQVGMVHICDCSQSDFQAGDYSLLNVCFFY